MNLKKNITFALILLKISVFGQVQAKEAKIEEILVPLEAEHWEFKPQTVEFLEYKGRKAMKTLTSNDPVLLKDFTFTNGTIEYDMEPLDENFTSLYFRRKSSKENECFYFRTSRAADSMAIDAIQYAPTIDGVNLWDMLYHFQSNADFKRAQWNHVKLVITEKQMRVYVNSTDVPVLEVPYLEGNVTVGGVAFDGQVIISNLVVKPEATEGLSSKPGADPTANDIRYIRNWEVSEPITTEPKTDFHNDYYPDSTMSWKPITAERRGLINLTRRFGKSDSRRIVWLKTTVHSILDQETKLNLGFSDEVWIFINGRYLYVDKNYYSNPIMKTPDGRCSLENTSFSVPLVKGENELLIGVGNSFYGWGIVARFDKLANITLQD